METVAVVMIEEKWLTSSLQKAKQDFVNARGELVLDFSAVHRIDAAGLQALEEFARFAGKKEVKVALRGVNVDLYKALKLMGVSGHFLFVS
ncbi:MAG: sodium-independent anion transporter [Candidatus Sulfotelmatobacter sp.]